MATNTALTLAQKQILDFSRKVNGNYVMNQLQSVLGQNAGTFATSLIEVFTNDKQLQACDPNKVVQEAIKSATLHLPLNKQLGYAYLLVYNNWDKDARRSIPTPTLVIGYKGLIQLALRSGQYKNINVDTVYRGEMKGFDKLKGTIDFSGAPEEPKVIEGYFAHFELNNGFSKTLYMSLADMAAYALKYAPAFKSRPKNPEDAMNVDKLCDLAQEQDTNGPAQGKTGWLGDFNAMAQKTVLRRLLSKFGYLSVEMISAITKDEEQETDTFTDAQEMRDEDNAQPKPAFNAAAIVEDIEPEPEDNEEPPI